MIENGVFCINALVRRIRRWPISSPAAAASISKSVSQAATGASLYGFANLRNAAASFDCRLIEAQEAGTHFVMIGRVEAVAYGDEGDTLAYVHRGYRTL